MNKELELLYEGEKIDQLGYQGLRIIQDPQKFKFTMDAFLLAGFIKPQAKQQIFDLGTGSGVLPLLLAGQDQVSEVCGIELQPELVALARRNVSLNHLEAQVRIIEGDLKELPLELKLNSFDYVISNPPFFPLAQGSPSLNKALALARFEIACNIEEVLQAAVRMVRGNGRVALIFPAERLGDLFTAFSKTKLALERLCLVHPKADAPANLVLVEARPGGKSKLKVLPPLFVYDESGNYTLAMQQIFRGQR